MKLLVFAMAVIAAAIVAADDHNKAGFKIRVTKNLIDEMLRVRKEMMTNDMETMKKSFKRKMTGILRSMPGGMGYFEKPKIKDVVLLKHEEGEGPKIQFEEPNKISFSHGNCQSNFKVVIKDQGKEGTVNVEMNLKSIKMTLAFTKTETGMIQINKGDCGVEVGDVSATFEGFGDEKDKTYNEKASADIAKYKEMFQTGMCTYVDMGLGMVNAYLQSKKCTVELPGKRMKDIKIALCLVEDPKATANYLEMAFCGGTSFKDEELTHDQYAPTPMDLGDTAERMMYVLDNQVMMNRLMVVMFENGRLIHEVDSEKHPGFSKMLRKGYNTFMEAMGKTALPDDAVLKTTLSQEKAPVTTITEGSFKVAGHMGIAHKVENCESCEKDEGKGVVDYEVELKLELMNPEDDERVLPDHKFQCTALKAEIIDFPQSDELKEETKKGIEAICNFHMKRFAEKHKKHEKHWFPKYSRFMKLRNFAVAAKDGHTQCEGDINIDAKKMHEFGEHHAKHYGHDHDDDDDDSFFFFF